jgi:hypothetical protein
MTGQVRRLVTKGRYLLAIFPSSAHPIPLPSSSSVPPQARNPHSLTPPSGRKIIEILQKNPNKDPEKYDEDDIAHMRKVVAYCKRHLAQEEKAKQDPESRSARSLKNWGHNPQKA